MKRYNDLLIIERFDKTEYVPISQVVYCESFKGATKINIVSPDSLLAKRPLNEVIKVIDDSSFMRINSSQYLNKAYIDRLNESEQFLTTILHHKLVFTSKQD